MSILQKLIPNSNKVAYIYVVPSDKAETATEAIERAAWHHQAWYQYMMANSRTFSIHPAVVTRLNSTHDSDWFNTNVNGSDRMRYWNNARLSVEEFLGHRPVSETWMIYVDSQNAAGMAMGAIVGDGIHGSIAVMGAEDVSGLLGHHPNRTVCRQIGGDAHELGHTFGLHHPDRSDPDYPRALMGTGYGSYPACILRQPDFVTLDANPFLSDSWTKRAPFNLCSFNQRPRPAPQT